METNDKANAGTGFIPVYRHSAEYAMENNETPEYRVSYKANLACKTAIEEAIGENYHDNRLDTKATCAQLGHHFGYERVSYVLAVTIRRKNHDGRISTANKEWAASVPMADDITSWGSDRNASLVVDRVNPGLVDLLVNQVRKELVQERNAPEKKPSVLERLQKSSELSAATATTAKAHLEAEL